jgi:hypothetical protein
LLPDGTEVISMGSDWRHIRSWLPLLPLLVIGVAHSRVGLIWNGDLSTGNWSQWTGPQACSGSNPVAPAGTVMVQNPLPQPGGMSNVVKFTVADTSVSANCPVLGSPGDPNAMLIGRNIFVPGMNVYIAFSIYLPVGFPRICTPYVPRCFFSFAEVYGPPYDGSPPYAIMGANQHFALGTLTNPDAWNSPKWVPGRWNQFILHVKFETDRSGFVQLYYNGALQTLSGPSGPATTLYESTLVPGVNWNGSTPNHLSLQQYRSGVVKMGTIVTYESGARVGPTLDSVLHFGRSAPLRTRRRSRRRKRHTTLRVPLPQG